jgi:cytochrome P450
MGEPYALDMFDPAYSIDPYPMLDRMREQAPIQFDPRLHGWLLGRHRDLMALQRDPRLSSRRYAYMSAALPPELKERITPLIDFASTWLTMLDGAEHMRIRKLGMSAFQPRFLSRMADRIREVCDGLITRGQARGRIDVMAEIAYPLTQIIIAEMVGIPEGDRHLLLGWVADFNGLLAASINTAERIDRARESFADMRAYFARLIADRRARPVPDELLTSLVIAADGVDRLADDEIIALLAFIIAGAYDTTAHLIGNAMELLLEHPSAWARLREAPDLVPSALEEVLRCEPSILLNTRLVVAPIDHEGFRFEPGHVLYFLSGAANRDPEVFPEPARFDVTRKDNRHVSFGFGPHFCLGAALARLEAQIAIQRFLALTPDARLAEQSFQRAPGFITRPLQQLLIEV